jgi:hypothetical protein
MQLIWREVVRTGSVEGDQNALTQLQARANQEGVDLRVESLPGGGLDVSAYPKGSTALAANPYAPPAMAAARPAAMGMSMGTCCQLCGRRAPTKQVTFMQNIGVIIMRFPKRLSGQLCRTCIGKTFQTYTLVTFFLGWWGVISFFYSLVSIPVNIVNYLGARDLPNEFEG